LNKAEPGSAEGLEDRSIEQLVEAETRAVGNTTHQDEMRDRLFRRTQMGFGLVWFASHMQR
jgi:hypothetical protein